MTVQAKVDRALREVPGGAEGHVGSQIVAACCCRKGIGRGPGSEFDVIMVVGYILNVGIGIPVWASDCGRIDAIFRARDCGVDIQRMGVVARAGQRCGRAGIAVPVPDDVVIVPVVAGSRVAGNFLSLRFKSIAFKGRGVGGLARCLASRVGSCDRSNYQFGLFLSANRAGTGRSAGFVVASPYVGRLAPNMGFSIGSVEIEIFSYRSREIVCHG